MDFLEIFASSNPSSSLLKLKVFNLNTVSMVPFEELCLKTHQKVILSSINLFCAFEPFWTNSW